LFIFVVFGLRFCFLFGLHELTYYFTFYSQKYVFLYSGGAVTAAAPVVPAAPAAPAAVAKSSGTAVPVASAQEASAPAVAPAGGRVIASPLAKKAASEKGIDISQVTGTGPSSRVILADVLEFKPTTAASATPKATVSSASTVSAPKPVAVTPAATNDYVDLPLSNIRKVIASRLSLSKQTIPHYYITVDVQMDAIMKLRAELNAKIEDKKNHLSVNDFIIKASALSLRKVPDVNQSWMDSVVRRYNYVDVSVAVSTEGGLITPIVKDADLKGLATISAEVKELASRARQNKLQPHEFQGGM
jgi:pyruvate dehydrogenase E2 component (dihydrolipoamide acetyltransferase)